MDSKVTTIVFTILGIFLLKIGMEKSMNLNNKKETAREERRFATPKVSLR